MGVALRVENLVKSYHENVVIKGISFTVEKGEIFALLGANGAGKTTTLECIEKIRPYDSGVIALKGTMGIQLQTSSLPDHISVAEAYTLFCKWNKVNPDFEIFVVHGLDKIKNKQYKDMSVGQKRRLHLALALIGDPDVIFLDEPTAGLDVEGRIARHQEIRKLRDSGKTIIMASHDMAEVESLCDRIAILRDGVIAFIGTSEELTRGDLNFSRIYVRLSESISDGKFLSCTFEGDQHGYEIYQAQNVGEALLEILTEAKMRDSVVIDLKIERVSLEERFIEIAKESVQ